MLADVLGKVLNCPVERGKSLSSLSTLGVGGWAECYVEPSDVQDFLSLWALRGRFPLHVLGGGSNVLFPDGELPGILISTRRWSAVLWQGEEAEAQAGYRLSALLEGAEQRGLGGMEFATGIPGTLGGAIAGNVGAGGRGVGELLTEVTTVEPDGALRRWGRGEFSCSYRHCSLAEEGRLFLSCKVRFSPLPEETIRAELGRFRNLRAPQPREGRSAGCSFKNPPEGSAGRLLDQCGCKGLTAGDAVVSDRHANFILNRGHASSADVLSLMKACRQRVFERTGILLEPEIKFLGFGQEEPFAA